MENAINRFYMNQSLFIVMGSFYKEGVYLVDAMLFLAKESLVNPANGPNN